MADLGPFSEVAKAEGVPFLDLNNIIADRYEQLGPDRVNPLFGDDHTHTTLAGAELNAEAVIAALKGVTSDPLKNFFSPKADDVAAARFPR